MIKYIFLFLVLCSCFIGFTQKPIKIEKRPVDTATIRHWYRMGNEKAISNDGKYFIYTITNKPIKSTTLVIKSTTNSWKKECIGVSEGFFSRDSKYFIFKSIDTLYFLSLKNDSLNYITDVDNYDTPEKENGEWIVYKLRSAKKIILLNVISNERVTYQDVMNSSFDEYGKVLILHLKRNEGGLLKESLIWVNLYDNDKSINLWESQTTMDNVLGWQFDKTGSQLVFIVNNKEKRSNTIYYYKKGMALAENRFDDQSSEIPKDLKISNSIPQFSPNGEFILFNIQLLSEKKSIPESNIKVNIWNYKDLLLPSEQLLVNHKPRTFPCGLNIKDNYFVRLCNDGDKMLTLKDGIKSNYVIITDNSYTSDNAGYKAKKVFYIVSLKNGKKIQLQVGKSHDYVQFKFSPGGKYLIYYDTKQQSYLCYNIKKNETVNISKGIPVSFASDLQQKGISGVPDYPVGVAGWLDNDSSVFVYDNYDIWQLDPNGLRKSVCITSRFGILNHIKFRFLDDDDESSIRPNTSLFLTAFNVANKKNGFYRINIGKINAPEMLIMESAIIYLKESQTSGSLSDNMKPLKADSADVWLIQRQTASDAPNLFLTSDFKNLTKLTSLDPQKDFNWLTTTLVTWKLIDGRICRGILYKPENFDAKKKYPLIIKCYEEYSDELFHFPYLGFTQSSINVPWFVSNGYLVFTPDIKFKAGYPGKSVYNSVISFVNYVSRFSWIDIKKIALNGHSFGGYEINYLITHSNIFAAAAEAAGTCDLISSYGSLRGGGDLGSNNQSHYETGQGRMGISLWERSDLYIANSPIFKIDKVATPLLIMHNKNDENVPFGQGVELFLALRRLNKPAWMLQYDQGKHILLGKESIDYTIRITEFFNHYLKGLPAPQWMTNSNSIHLKLNSSKEVCSDNCSICKSQIIFSVKKIQKNSIP